MENKFEENPPFFKEWKGLYTFVLVFEVVLILIFIWISNTSGA
tara:strand:+ start:38202 stop:38330 length:129 start_codon:yes stop_codon:yes gene_type:complete